MENSRVLHFRGWDKVENIYIKSDYKGSLNAIGFHGLPITIDSDSFKKEEIVGWNIDHRVILEQYTGLKDRCGIEIYEGDRILLYKEEKCHIYWSRSGACFCISTDSDNENSFVSHFNLSHSKVSEVIGNIHEGVKGDAK